MARLNANSEGRGCAKSSLLIGIAAATGIVVAWSASTLAKSNVVNSAEVIAASAPIVPNEIMVTLGKRVPAECWSHPF
jgi:hypothetical protein